MAPDLDEAAQILAHWAERQPLVRRVWIFGSRARGNHRPDSDLDVAVELDPETSADECGGLTYWMAQADAWRGQLRLRVGVPSDLQWFQPSSKVASYVDECSRLVYVKAGARLE